MEKRPFIASECNYLPDAEKWRQDVIKEIVRDVTQVREGREEEGKEREGERKGGKGRERKKKDKRKKNISLLT